MNPAKFITYKPFDPPSKKRSKVLIYLISGIWVCSVFSSFFIGQYFDSIAVTIILVLSHIAFIIWMNRKVRRQLRRMPLGTLTLSKDGISHIGEVDFHYSFEEIIKINIRLEIWGNNVRHNEHTMLLKILLKNGDVRELSVRANPLARHGQSGGYLLDHINELRKLNHEMYKKFYLMD